MANDVWVEADDGLFYRNPVLEGPTWVIQCVVIDSGGRLVNAAIFQLGRLERERRSRAGYRAGIILDEIGLGTDDFGDPIRVYRPPLGLLKDNPLECWTWHIPLAGPLPKLFLTTNGFLGRSRRELDGLNLFHKQVNFKKTNKSQ